MKTPRELVREQVAQVQETLLAKAGSITFDRMFMLVRELVNKINAEQSREQARDCLLQLAALALVGVEAYQMELP